MKLVTKRKIIRNTLISGLILAASPIVSQARDQIQIVGSSTVYPFSTLVAERFGGSGKFKTPVVESTGTGGGCQRRSLSATLS